MENWQESYKKHQILANEITEKVCAQEALRIGIENWEEEGQLLTKGELTHIRLWLNDDELSDIEKKFIAESNTSILNQTHQTTASTKNNDLFIGLISTNIIALLLVFSAVLYYFITNESQHSKVNPQTKVNPQKISELEEQVAILTTSLRSEKESSQQSLASSNQQVDALTIQKNAYYSKWILLAVDYYIEQQQLQTATALLLKAFEDSQKTQQAIFLNRLYKVIIQHGQQTLNILDKHQVDIHHSAFSPDSKHVVTVSIEGFGYLWNMATAEVEKTFMLPDWVPLSYAKFSQDGAFLLIVGGNTVLVWDMMQQKQIGLLQGHEEQIFSATFSNDNQYIATASQDKTARLWKTETGEQLQTYIGHQDIIYAIEFNNDSQLIATSSKDGTAKLWQVETGKLVHSLGNYQNTIAYLCFQNDSLITATFDGQIQSWDIETFQPLQSFNSKEIALRNFACHTNKIAAAFEDNMPPIWNVTSSEPIVQVTHDKPIYYIDFNEDLLVTASEKEVYIWALKSQKQLYAFTYSKRIRQVLISPDKSSLLVVAGELAYIYPLFASQEAILQAAKSIVGDSELPDEILKQFEMKQ